VSRFLNIRIIGRASALSRCRIVRRYRRKDRFLEAALDLFRLWRSAFVRGGRDGIVAFERQAGVLPVEEATRVAAHVPVAAPDEIAIERDAREAVGMRAIHDDLVVR